MSKARELAELGNAYSDGALSNRNLIVNGAMQVAQRGTNVTGVTNNGYYVCDRFTQEFGGSGTWTLSQSTDAPNGFRNSAKWECTTSAVQGVTTFAVVEHRLEKQNLAHLQYGTADAKDVTLSFWVKSNKTGDYNCNILVENNTNPDRMISSKYTIISANTWEYKTITFEGDTSLDLLIEESNSYLQIEWWLGGGTTFTGSSGIGLGWQNKDNAKRANETVNLADTIGNYWQITGVQLEVGDTATPFEHRSYGQELALCERYLQTLPVGGSAYTAIVGYDASIAVINLRQTMRASPSLLPTGITGYGSGNTEYRVYVMSNGGGGFLGSPVTANFYIDYSTPTKVRIVCSHAIGWYNSSFEHTGSLIEVGAGCKVLLEAEL